MYWYSDKYAESFKFLWDCNYFLRVSPYCTSGITLTRSISGNNLMIFWLLKVQLVSIKTMKMCNSSRETLVPWKLLTRLSIRVLSIMKWHIIVFATGRTLSWEELERRKRGIYLSIFLSIYLSIYHRLSVSLFSNKTLIMFITCLNI